MSEHGIYTEISTDTCIVAIVAPGHDLDAQRVVSALWSLLTTTLSVDSVTDVFASDRVARLDLPTTGEAVMTPRDAYFAPADIVPAREAVGRISADTLAAYPPGIPNVLPGERITAETIDFLTTVASIPGGYVRGALNPRMDALRVVRQV